MAESRADGDLVVAPGQYALLLDSTKGNVDVLVGPTKTSLSGTDSPVTWDRQNRTFVACSQAQAKQQFPTAPEGFYIVVENPALSATSGYKEHPLAGTRTNAVDLAVGRRMNIPGPCSFALYPGQAADVIQGHHLRSNQYLLVRVYNDTEAKTNWAHAVVRAADGTDTTLEPPSLHMGQLLVIKGTDVSFYIPPTGIEVLLDENNNFVRNAETLELLEFCILLNENGEKRYVIGPDVVFPEPTETFVAQSGTRKGRAIELNQISGVYVKVIAEYEDSPGGIPRKYEPGDELFITGKEASIYYPRPEHSLIKYGDRIVHYAVAIPEGEGRYVLNRLTGDVRIEHGPSMFLPDPREEVVVRRILSDSEVTLLYPGNLEALRHNRMLRESSQVNANDVPMASMALAEDIDTTYRDAQVSSRLRGGGDPTGRSAAVSGAAMAPMPYGTSTPRGAAIASSSMANAAYASTVTSGESAAQALVGGTTQRRTTNTPPRTITLDTKYDGVVSVDVWTGYAALLVRKNGARRVVVGPRTVLLEYDERPMMLELSTGTPKTDVTRLKTGFLRVLNNSVSDQVTVETSDSFVAQITLRYYLNFGGSSPEEWFAVENYVQFLAERTRSLIRREAKRHTVRELRDNAIDIVRTLLLGDPAEGVARRGRTFEENQMMVFDVDVETPVIQGDIDRLLRQTEQDTLRQSLTLDTKERELIHQTRMEEIEQKLQQASADTAELRGRLILQDLQRTRAEQVAVVVNREAVTETHLAHQVDQQQQLDFISTAELTRTRQERELETSTERAHIDNLVLEFKERAAAFTPQLVEVLNKVGQEQFLAALTANMSPLAILGGKTVVEVLQGILGTGNPAGDALTNLISGFIAPKEV